jgi:hypothetical protein
MSSLLSVLQDWLRNDRTQNQNQHQQHLRQDYESLRKLVSDYQHTMSDYQTNMNMYLLLLTSLQVNLLNSQTPISSSSTAEIPRENAASASAFTPFSTTTEQIPVQTPFPTSSSQARTPRTSTRVYPRGRRPANRSNSTTNSFNTLRPLISRYHSTAQNGTNSNETTRLFDSLLRDNQGGGRVLNLDICGNSLLRGLGLTTTETSENRWRNLFPAFSSTSESGSRNSEANSIFSDLEHSNNSTTTPAVNRIDIVFEYDDQLQQFNNQEGEESLQRLLQSDDFRNQILRTAGIDNQSNVLRWIMAPTGLEDSEPRGLTMGQIRDCTESLVYSEGMEGLLSTVCPITMEEYVEGDRLLQLLE